LLVSYREGKGRDGKEEEGVRCTGMDGKEGKGKEEMRENRGEERRPSEGERKGWEEGEEKGEKEGMKGREKGRRWKGRDGMGGRGREEWEITRDHLRIEVFGCCTRVTGCSKLYPDPVGMTGGLSKYY